MLVNVSQANLQLSLQSPDPEYKNKNMNRPGTVISLNLKRGEAMDILPHFNGSLEKTHASVKYSRDVLRLLRPHLLHTYVCDDANKEMNVEELLGKSPKKKAEKKEEKLEEKLEEKKEASTKMSEENTDPGGRLIDKVLKKAKGKKKK